MIHEQKDIENFHTALDIPVGDYGDPKIQRAQLRAALIMEEASEACAAMLGVPVFYTLPDADAVQEAAEAALEDGIPTPHVSVGEEIMVEPKNYGKPDMVETIDGLIDTLVVTYGSAVEFGIDLAPFWDIVHTSNMAKEGGPTREDGKKLKPEGWEPPDILGLYRTIYGTDPS